MCSNECEDIYFCIFIYIYMSKEGLIHLMAGEQRVGVTRTSKDEYQQKHFKRSCGNLLLWMFNKIYTYISWPFKEMLWEYHIRSFLKPIKARGLRTGCEITSPIHDRKTVMNSEYG